MAETLVLDQSYTPIGRVGWQRAVTLLWSEKIEVLETYTDRVIRSASEVFPMPSVVRFFKGLRRRKGGAKFSRENIYFRDGGYCQYCGTKVSRDEFTYDHVIPRSRGGKTCWENIVSACIPCNLRKKARTPKEAGMRLRTKPVRPLKGSSGDGFKRIFFNESMPEEWAWYLGAGSYWKGELDTD